MEKAKVIPFFSLKGGVGKSVISLNIAIELALQKKRVLLLDIDIKAPQNISKFMELKSKYCLYDLASHFKDFRTEKKHLENYLAQHRSGLHFLPAISSFRQRSSIKPETIKEFLLLCGEKFDYIIVDAGSNLNDQVITTFDLSNLIFLIVTPDIASIYQTEWTIDTLQSLGYPLRMMKVIINRAKSKGGVSLEEMQLLLMPGIISHLPSEGKIMGLSLNNSSPVVIDAPRAKISLAIKELTEKLISDENLYIERRELGNLSEKRKNISGQNHKIINTFLSKVGIEEEPKRVAEEEDQMIRLKKRIHVRLLDEMNLKKVPVDRIMSGSQAAEDLKEKAAKIIFNIVAEEAKGFISSIEVRQKIIKEILDESLGLGPLEDLLKDPTVSEIMINNKDQIYIERSGKVEPTTKKFTSNGQVRIVIERILAPLGRRIDESSPYVDARLPDGSRVNAIIPPLSLTGPTLTIRKFSQERLTINDLMEKYHSVDKDMISFIEACVKARKNILVSGGTGSGKTTLLNIISEFIPHGERLVTIEDSAELNLSHIHWVRLESRPPNIEGKGEITIRNLFRNSLRMRPDRIIVGEVRGREVLDMLQAMNTGHDGSLSTVHANSTRDVLIRLDSMILMSGVELPIRAIREIISSALDLIIHTARMSDGSRKVIQVTEVGDVREDTSVELKDIFKFKQRGIDPEGNVLGRYAPTGFIPTFYEDMLLKGLNIPKKMFEPKAVEK